MQPNWAESPVFRQQIFLVNNYSTWFVCNSDGVHMGHAQERRGWTRVLG